MNTSARLSQMKNYVAERLQASGEFSAIEPGYNFRGMSDNPALHEEAQRHVFCTLRPEYSPSGDSIDFLVVADADTMPGKLFARKLEAASDLGIYSVHVLYRYINSTDKPTTQGPLFQRFVLPENKAKGMVAYRQKAPFGKNSLAHYPKATRDNFRLLREIERDRAYATSAGLPLYYQPQSARLEQALKRYAFDDVVFKGVDGFGNPRQEVSKTIKNPILVEDLTSFTLQPMLRGYNPAAVQWRLGQGITGKVLLADFVDLPDLEISGHADSGQLRHNVGLLQHGQLFNLEWLVNESLERIGIQTEHLPESTYEQIAKFLVLPVNRASPAEEEELPVRTVRRITVKSRTHPEIVHYIAKTTDTQTGDTRYTCSCKGFTFRNKCGHIEELDELNGQ